MSDITNYAYIWYKKDPTKLLDFTPEEQNLIFKIILDYSYPCYLANDSIQTMSEADRKELLERELLFIQKKFEETCLVDVMIMQIPRVLYDLFNIYYYKKNESKFKFNYYTSNSKIDDPFIIKRKEYNNLTSKYTAEAKPHILMLNNYIINHIVSYLSNITTEYNGILESIFCELNMLDFPLLEESKKIIRQVINFEKEPSTGNTILYRGAKLNLDSTKESGNIIHSISLNISILSGFINDNTACTLNYIKSDPCNIGTYWNDKIKNNDKIKYIIKKFHINDSSNEYSLFFIPPIHPFLQLYSNGELWHPRTKIGWNYEELETVKIHGLYDDLDLIRNCDYLISDKTYEELECLYQQYKSNKQISVWKKKYLKYKNKYLELKKYISSL
jgi:hypothetical protein